jgi:hypothetical protein
MPDGYGDDAPVTWGRFTATFAALEARVAGLEAGAARRKDRGWTLLTIILAGLALPILVSLVSTLIG